MTDPTISIPTIAMLDAARGELACQTCGNSGRGYMGGECPECHGEHRNAATIRLLEALTDHATGYIRRVMR
jgi:hypothetical protein